jgi:hypothetical protein
LDRRLASAEGKTLLFSDFGQQEEILQQFVPSFPNTTI